MQLLIAIFIAIIIYLAQMKLYAKYWNKNLSVKVEYSTTDTRIGENVCLIETIENAKALPLPVLNVKFSSSKTFLYEDMDNTTLSDHYYRNDIFSVAGNQQVVRKLSFTTTQRGCFIIRNIDLVATDIFMKRHLAAMYENHGVLYVYPKLIQTKEFIELTSSIIGKTKQTELFEDPFAFKGIREYTATDSMNQINWKASAKVNHLMVNTHFDNQNARVVLLFNIDTHVTQRSYRLAETCISMAATLLFHFNKAGLSYKMAVNAKEPTTDKLLISDFGKGEEHYKNLLRTLCRLDLKKEPEDFLSFFHTQANQFSQKNENTTYVILSNYRKPLLTDIYGIKQKEGYHMHFICPERKECMTIAPYVTYVEVNPDAL